MGQIEGGAGGEGNSTQRAAPRAAGVQRATETATPSSQAFEMGPKVGILALNRVGGFLSQGDGVLTAMWPDLFSIGGMPITGVTGNHRQGAYYRLQGRKAAILAHLLSHNQPSGAGDRDDHIDFAFFRWAKV